VLTWSGKLKREFARRGGYTLVSARSPRPAPPPAPKPRCESPEQRAPGPAQHGGAGPGSMLSNNSDLALPMAMG